MTGGALTGVVYPDPRPIVVISPGASTSWEDAEAWMRPMASWLAHHGVESRLFWPGHIKVLLAGTRWVGSWVRLAWTMRFQWFVQELQRTHPGRPIDLVAHSMAAWVGHHSLTLKPGALFLRRMVLMGGVVSSRATWLEEIGHYDRVLNFYSWSDGVAMIAPTGHSGWRGFTRPGLDTHISNREMRGYEHADYLYHGEAWEMALEFLLTGTARPTGI